MPIAFKEVGVFGGLGGETLSNPTSLQFGPDGRLYVSEQNGTINAFTVSISDGKYVATAQEVLKDAGGNEVVKSIQNHFDDGSESGLSNRQVTGIVVAGTAEIPVLYISSSNPDIAQNGDKNLDTNSGVVSRATWNPDANGGAGAWDVVDLVRGLPRSEENHAVNGMLLNEDGTKLLLQVGGFTNNGAPSGFFSYTNEYALSGAILELDLVALDALPDLIDPQGGQGNTPRAYKYDLPTLDDPNRANAPDTLTDAQALALGFTENSGGMDLAGPWGGNDGLNMAILPNDAPLRLYADGLRNAYDLARTPDGNIYTVDNGSNGGLGGAPSREGVGGDLDGDGITNEAIGTPNSSSYGEGEPLFLIEEGGFYQHANPVRSNQNMAWTVYNNSGAPDTSLTVNQVADISALVPAKLIQDGKITEGFLIDPSKFAGLEGLDPNDPADRALIDARLFQSGQGVDRDTAASVAITTVGSSTNGVVVYDSQGQAFNGVLDGKLFVTQFNDNITLLNINADGTALTPVLAEGPDGIFGTADDVVQQGGADGILEVANNTLGVALGNPLDVTMGPGGTLWVAEIGSNEITVLAPSDLILPGDTDGDDDGILNVNDPFMRDAANGTGVQILPGQVYLWDFDPNQDDNLPGPDGFGGGLTGVMINKTTDFEQFLQADYSGPGTENVINLDNMKFITAAGGGNTVVENVSAGDATGAANSAEFLFHTGVQLADNVGAATIKWSMFNPAADIDGAFQQIGGYIGTGDQSNYLKLVAIEGATGGDFQIVLENGDQIVATQTIDAGGVFDAAQIPTQPPGKIFLELLIDVIDGTAIPKITYDVNGGQNTATGASIDLAGTAVLEAIRGDYTVQGQPSGLAVGLYSSSVGQTINDVEDTFGVAFDDIEITATEAQLPPDAVDDAAQTGVNAALIISVAQLLANDSDPNPSDTLTVTGVSNPVNGTVSLANGVVTFTPGAGFEGAASFDYAISDGNGGTDTATVDVTVANEVILYRVNAGGGAVAAIDGGPTWLADSTLINSTGPVSLTGATGNTYSNAITDTAAEVEFVAGENAADASVVPWQVYVDERSDNSNDATKLTYTFDVEAGKNYKISLFYTENWVNVFGFAAGTSGGKPAGQSRQFDVAVEGQVPEVFNGLNPLAEALALQGGTLPTTNGASAAEKQPYLGVALQRDYTYTATDDKLTLTFDHEFENPKINAIQISQVGGAAIPPKPVVNIISGDAVVNEDDGTVQVSILTSFTVPADKTVDVNFQIEPIGGATPGAGGDYVYSSASAIFGGGVYTDTKSIAGSSSDLTIPIQILADDLPEGAEAFKLTILSVSPNATLGSNSEATLTIAANDTVAGPGDVLFRINAGGPAVAANDGGPAWTADQSAVTANGNGAVIGAPSPYLVDRGVAGDDVTYGNNPPAGPGTNATGAPDGLFTTERFSALGNPNNIGYAFDVPNGSYIVNLYFDELFFGAAGSRVFDVEIEGGTVLDDFDTYVAAGNSNNTIKQSFVVPVTDGVLNLEFLKGAANNPHIAAIEIIDNNGAPGLPQISIAAPTPADAQETGDAGVTTLAFPVTFDAAPTESVTVGYTVDIDGVETTGALVLGTANGVITVEVPNDDTDNGADSVTVTLTGVTAGASAAELNPLAVSASATVVEDDGAPVVDPDDIDADGILNIDDPFAYDGDNGLGRVLTAGGAFTQDFNTPTEDPFDANGGFTGILVNPAFNPPGASETDPYGDRTVEDKVTIANGALSITSSLEDSNQTGTGLGNLIRDNYQSGMDVSGVETFEVVTRASSADWVGVLGTNGFAQFGVKVGAGGLDDFIKLVVSDRGAGATAIQLAHNGTLVGGETNVVIPVPPAAGGITLDASTTYEVRLIVDRSVTLVPDTATAVAGEVTGIVEFFDGAGASMGTVETGPRYVLTTSAFAAAMTNANPLTGGTGGIAYGVSITDGTGADNQFTADFDFLTIRSLDVAPTTPVASIADAGSVVENGDTDATTLSFPVTFDTPPTSAVTVEYTLDIAGIVTSGLQAVIPAAGGAITVEVQSDAVANGDEAVTVTLTGVVSGAADLGGQVSGSGTVTEDDAGYTPPVDDLFGTPVEISNDRGTPSDGGVLSIGANVVTATQEGESGENSVRDRDYFTFTVPDGAVLTGIILTGYDIGDDDTAEDGFMGIQLGGEITVDPITGAPDAGTSPLLGAIVYAPGDVGANLLSLMAAGGEVGTGTGFVLPGFEAALTGQVAVWLNQGAGPNAPTLTFVVEEQGEISIADAPTIAETGDDGFDTLLFPLTGPAGATVTLDYTVDGAAQTPLEVIFDGTGAATLSVAVAQDDAINADDVIVELTGVSSALYAIGAAASATGVITEDDAAAQLVRGDVVAAFNAGGPALVQDGIAFAAAESATATPFAGGQQYTDGLFGQPNQAVFDGTVYETEVNDGGDGTFTFSTSQGIDPSKKYFVDLYFAEIFESQAGTRIFNVTVEDAAQPVLANLNVVTESGDVNLPFVAELVDPIEPGVNGAIDLRFDAVGQRAKVSAIVIREAVAPAADGTITIADAPQTQENGDTGDTLLVFPLSITGPDATVTLSYTVNDEAQTPVSVTFTAGVATLDVPVANDDLPNGPEGVTVVLTGVTEASFTIGAADTASGAVTEDDLTVGTAPDEDLDGDGIANEVDDNVDGDTALNGDETFSYDASNAGTALIQGEMVTLDFDTDGTPFQNGLTGALVSSKPATVEIDLGAAAVANGVLTIRASVGDSFTGNNTQQNALVAGFRADDGMRVETRFAAPDWNANTAGVQTPVSFQSAGLVIGLDQDNYIKAVFGRSAQEFEFGTEIGGAANNTATDLIATNDYAAIAEIVIALEVFIDTSGASPVAKAQAYGTLLGSDGLPLAGADAVQLGAAKTLSGALATAVLNGAVLGAGVIQTANGDKPVFDVSYEYLKVTALGTPPLNEAPTVATPLLDQTPDEDALYSFAIPAGTFADDAGEDALVLTATLADGGPLPDWLSFDAATGAFSGTPLQTDVDAGAITVKVTATDAQAESAFDEFTLTPQNVNDAPTIGGALAPVDTTLGVATTVDLSGLTLADEDGDVPTLVAVSQGETTLPAGITLVGTSLEVADDTPEGTYTIDVFANDGTVNSDTPVSVTVTVGAPPTGEPIRIQGEDFDSATNYAAQVSGAADQGQVAWIPAQFQTGSMTYDLNTAERGVDAGQYRVVIGYFDENDGVSTITASISAGGTQSFSQSWVLDETTGGNAAQATSFRIAAFDNVTVGADAVLTIEGIRGGAEHARIDYIEFIPLSGGGDPDNLPPYVVGEVPDQSLLQTEDLNLDLNNYVFDPEEDALTYTVEAVDPVDADVSWITVVDGVLGGTPGATGVGVTEIRVIVNDGANVIEIPLTIEVDKVNTPPETTGIANQILTEDQAFAPIDVRTAFSDLDNDPLTYEATDTLPPGVTFANGVFSGAPTDPGSFQVTVTASDGEAEVSSTFFFNVAPVTSAGETVRIEAEDFTYARTPDFNGFFTETLSQNRGEVIRLGANKVGEATLDLDGVAGLVPGAYDVRVFFFDENDGVSSAQLLSGDGGAFSEFASWQFDQNSGGNGTQTQNFRTLTFSGLTVEAGTVLKIAAQAQGGEFARIDYIELAPVAGAVNFAPFEANGVEDVTQPVPGPIAIDLEAIAAFGDPEENPLSYSVLSGQDWLSFNGAVLEGTPPASPGTYLVEIGATDGPSNSGQTAKTTFTITVEAGGPVNLAPTGVTVTPVAAFADGVPEGLDITNPVKVADIAVTDDGLGDNVLGLTGSDADLFEIIGLELFLKAGQTLDATANPTLDVAVTVNDATVGGDPDATSAPLTIPVTETGAPEDQIVLRINAFGPEVAATDGSGVNWQADLKDVPGTPANENSVYLDLVSTDPAQDRGDAFGGYTGNTALIPAGVPEAVLDTARSSNAPFSYNIPVGDISGPGSFRVNLYFAELFTGNQVIGDRVFDIGVEGQTTGVLDNFDPSVPSGGGDLRVVSYEVTVQDGVLNIDFAQELAANGGADNPIVNAIEIVRLGAPAADTTPPTAAITLTNPADATAALGVSVALADASGINAATLGAEDLLVTGAAGAVSFNGFANGVATYSVAAPAGGWQNGAAVEVTLKAGEVADQANPANTNAATSQSLTLDIGGGSTGGGDRSLTGDLNDDGELNNADADIDGDGIANGADRAAYDAANTGPLLSDVGEIAIDFGVFADGASPFEAGFTGVAQTASGAAELNYATNNGAQVSNGRLTFQTSDADTNNGEQAFTFLADINGGNFTFAGTFDNPVFGGTALPTFSQYGLLISLTGTPGASTAATGDFFKFVTGNPGNGMEMSGRGSFAAPDAKAAYPAGVTATNFAEVTLSVTALNGALTGTATYFDASGGVLGQASIGPITPIPGSALANVLSGASNVQPAFGVTSTDTGGGGAFTIGVQEISLKAGGGGVTPPDAGNAEEAFAAQDDLFTDASYGANVAGAAVLKIMAGQPNVAASNFGANSFEVENTGAKKISAIFIDVTSALYPDSVFDPDGKGGDSTAKAWAVNSAGGTGGYVSGGVSGYFLPGEDPLPNTTGAGIASNGGYKGAMVKFDANDDGGFQNGEIVGFSGDMDPNSIAGLPKSSVDAGAINGWDVGGISGHELIGSLFTVLFDDGTTASGQLMSDKSNAGSIAIASQALTTETVSLTVNGTAAGGVGVYGVTTPTVIVTGDPGQLVRVTMTRGLDPVTNETSGVDNLVEARLARYDFKVNNAFDEQSVDVTIGANGTFDASGLFTYGVASGTGKGGFAGDTTAQIGFVASAIANIGGDVVPVGPVTAPIYLTNQGGPVAGGPVDPPVDPIDGYYAAIVSGSSVRFKVQMEDVNGNGGANPPGDWDYFTAPDSDGNQAGFQGTGYYAWKEGAVTGTNSPQGQLEYTIVIPEGEDGNYTFRVRASRDPGTPSDQANDIWLKIDDDAEALQVNQNNTVSSGGFVKVFGVGTGGWGYSNQLDGEPDPNFAAVFNLSAGTHTITLAGRSGGYYADFWELYKGGTPALGASNSAFVPSDPDAPAAPVISGGATASVLEGSLTALDVDATDLNGDTLSYAITGGADAGLFSINGATGVVTFNTAPDFEAPADAGANNVYNLEVTVSDGGLSDVQAYAISVLDDPADNPGGGGGGGSTVRIEAENWTSATNYGTQNVGHASGGTVTRTGNEASPATLTYDLSGQAAAGTYRITIGYLDENDGQSTLTASIGSFTDSFVFNDDGPFGGPSSQNKREFTFDNVSIGADSTLVLSVDPDDGEEGRIDYIDFVFLDDGIL